MKVQSKRQVRELHTETDLQPEQIPSGASTPRFNAKENICKTLGNTESKDMQDEEITEKLEFMQTFGLNKEGPSLLDYQSQDLKLQEQDQLHQDYHHIQQASSATDKKKLKPSDKQYEIDWTQEGMFQFPTILTSSTDNHSESAQPFSSPMFFQKRIERQKQSNPEIITEKSNSMGVIPSSGMLQNGSKKGTRRIKLTPQAFNNAISKDIPGIALPKARVPSRGGSILRTSMEDNSQLKSQESRKPSQSYHVSSSSQSYLPKKNPQTLNQVEDFSSRRVSTEGPLKIQQSRPRWQSSHDSTQLFLQISPQPPQSAVSQSNFSSSQPISPMLCSQLLSPLFYAPSCVVSQSQSQKNSQKQSRAETPPHHIIFPKKKNQNIQEQQNKEGFSSNNNNPTSNNNRLLEVKLNNFQSSSSSKSHSLPQKKQSLFPLLTEPSSTDCYNYDSLQITQQQQQQYEQNYFSKQKDYYYQQMIYSQQLNPSSQGQSISPQKQTVQLGLSKQSNSNPVSSISKQGQQQTYIQQNQQQQLQSNMNLQSLVMSQQQQIQQSQQQLSKLSQSSKKTLPIQQDTSQQQIQQRLSQKSIKQLQYLQNPSSMLQQSQNYNQTIEAPSVAVVSSSKQLYNYHTLDQATSQVPSSSLSPKKNKSITNTSTTIMSNSGTTNTTTTTNNNNNNTSTPNSTHLLQYNSTILSNKNIRKNQNNNNNNNVSNMGNTTLTILNDKPTQNNTVTTKKQVAPNSNDIISTRKQSKELLENSNKKENSKKPISSNNTNINQNYYTSNNTISSKQDLSSFETQASSISPQDLGSKGFTWKRRESSDLTHLQKAQARLISKKPNFDELTQKLLSALRTLLDQLKGSSSWVITSILEQQKCQQPLWNMIVVKNNKKHNSNNKHGNQQQSQYQLQYDHDIQFQPSEQIEATLNELLASSLNKQLTVQTLLAQTTHLKLHITAAACSSSQLGSNVSISNTQVV